MKMIKLEPGLKYDGSQIKPMWAFQNLGVKGSSIVCWIGPMDIKSDELVDYEDVGLEIKSDEMIHFVVEHFDVQPADMGCVIIGKRSFSYDLQDFVGENRIKNSIEEGMICTLGDENSVFL